MPTIAEALVGQNTPINAALKAGIAALSYDQTIVFTRYKRVVLPLDGYVFWIRADLLSPSALLNGSPFNVPALNQPTTVLAAAQTLTVKGSLHYSSEMNQDESTSYAINRVVFTSEYEVQDLNAISDGTMWLAEFEGIRFAFSKRSSFYKQADLHHYSGDAVYPIMETQIIDDPAEFNGRSIIVSNSLPVWLALNAFMPMYPSFCVPDNIEPPFASVHVTPEGTRAIQSMPLVSANSSHFQLVKDQVRITAYGLRNDTALQFQDYVNNYSIETDVIGVMNSPVFRDDKRIQQELSTIAMKKTIEYEVSYYQANVENIARQLILSCVPSFIIAA